MREEDCSHFCLDNSRERLMLQQESCKENTNLVSLIEIVILNIFIVVYSNLKESLIEFPFL